MLRRVFNVYRHNDIKTYNDRKNMLRRVLNVYRHNDIKTYNDRIYTINKDFNVPQIRYRVCRTRYDTTAYSTVSNEQQADRGISVITPLPMGEGMGEGPLVVGFGSLYCRVSCCVGCPSLSSFSDIIHNFFSFRLCLYVFICYLCG